MTTVKNIRRSNGVVSKLMESVPPLGTSQIMRKAGAALSCHARDHTQCTHIAELIFPQVRKAYIGRDDTRTQALQ